MRLTCLEVKRIHQHNLMLAKILYQELKVLNIKIYETENESRRKSILSLSQNRIVSNFLMLDPKLSDYLDPLTQPRLPPERENSEPEEGDKGFCISPFRKVLRTLPFIRVILDIWHSP